MLTCVLIKKKKPTNSVVLQDGREQIISFASWWCPNWGYKDDFSCLPGKGKYNTSIP